MAASRVALVHDWLVTMGGAERVLEELARLFPDAPIYTGVVRPERLSPYLRSRRIIPTFVQRLPGAAAWYNRYLLFLMYGFEQFDLSAYDLVISSSSAVAKGVVTRAETRHVSYVHSPMRYAWDLYHEYRRRTTPLNRRLMGPVFHYARLWDRLAADRADFLVANSTAVARRIAKHYRRHADIVFPPVDVDRFVPGAEPGNYWLVVSRLVAYKRFDLAVEAANRLRRRLIIAGDGPERPRLERLAGPTVEFVGRVDDRRLVSLMQDAEGMVFPGEEDFGIAPVEMQAAGRPVVAFGRGGVLDTVIPGETGILFAEQTVEELVDAMERAERIRWDSAVIRANAERFRPERFREGIRRVLDDAGAGMADRPRDAGVL